MTKEWTAREIAALRARLGLNRTDFGRLLLGADTARADGWVARLEDESRPDHTKPTRPVVTLLRWIDQGGTPPDWAEITGRGPR